MGIFDSIGSLLTGGNNISAPGVTGLTQGYNLAQPQLDAGNANVANLISGQAVPYFQGQYGAAIPYLNAVYKSGQQGVDQLKTLLGMGPGGTAGAQTALAATPGYQFALNQGLDATNRNAAATGNTNSGGLLKALQDYGSGLANQTYQSAVSNLSPFTNMFTGGANSLANLFTGLGTGVSSLFSNQAQQQSPFYQSSANLGWNLGAGTGAYGAQQGMLDTMAGSNLLGGVLNFAGSSGGSNLLSKFSDERLKEDIEPVGKLFDGQNIYKFLYKGDPTPHIGLMAQEVELHTPEAVGEVAGFKTVDYGKAVERSASIFDQFLKAA